ncbi:N-acetylornithine carbamoyltransferase [Kangiella sediminilitoris]|uniref:N-acetylornithine carbamoyltransferase n=1 Tax=Kangiella sediminilitoris TaxID=1144748 RepID=A0A1B3BCR6_9GAMM|nr:N-acetylornithine carbamoyltransferase [Kangiella sediminilitoris]AOE50610.1 N-acetylornithine carbamoyltransferase [Kangiella sediminilitoris]
MKHFLTTEHWSHSSLQELIDFAVELKQNKFQPLLKEKSVALLFFNPSLRTRTSFELGVHQLGGQAVVLQPGKDAWPIEFELGSVMDGDAEEHIKEVAQVLSEYCDLIAVRAFPKFKNWQEDRQDKLINALAEHSIVPVINMETITHPCQELAHIMTLQEQLGDLKGKKYVLTWTYHPKPLNTAVANSALMIATKFGMDVTLLCPTEEYVLDEHYMNLGHTYSSEHSNQLTVSHDIDSAYDNADIVYAKSWGALPYFGQWQQEKVIRDQYKHFIVDEQKMAKTNNALFSHCLPLRRNIKATDAVVDSKNCVAIQEAGNRLHVQKSIMNTLMNHS